MILVPIIPHSITVAIEEDAPIHVLIGIFIAIFAFRAYRLFGERYLL